ncbi:MAG: Tetratricopeptide 2 repeat protein [Myxococcales bacterium]|nr:Tetratricopeptide 2 repeat protein [Myxococcales bacterium]
MGVESAFVDLRRLADWFATLSIDRQRTNAPPRALHIERIVEKLGTLSIPLLGRELCTPEVRRRDAARAALAHLATTSARARVIAALRSITTTNVADEGKVCALGLLAELGERGAATFSDPTAIQKRSAIALAAQLESAADVAAAADMMTRQLATSEMLQLLSVMSESSPAAAHRLGSELSVRLDLDRDVREQIEQLTMRDDVAPIPEPARVPRPAQVAVLVDAAARLVIVACRKVSGERKWRRWAVLVDRDGHVEDCIHEDKAETDSANLIAELVADGYRMASSDLEQARAIIAAAARVSAHSVEKLESPYYLGRDLLDLGNAHVGARAQAQPSSSRIGHAVELIASGEISRALALLLRCDTSNADVAGAIAACLLAEHRPSEAVGHLLRAIEAEPSWSLHHWNLAAAYHELGDARACYHALRRFIATSALPTGLFGDPEQPARVALAERMLLDLERAARLTGTTLARPRKKRAPKRQRS